MFGIIYDNQLLQYLLKHRNTCSEDIQARWNVKNLKLIIAEKRATRYAKEYNTTVKPKLLVITAAGFTAYDSRSS